MRCTASRMNSLSGAVLLAIPSCKKDSIVCCIMALGAVL